MHIFFSGIGGTGIGPLALIAHQAGFEVSGSDKQNSKYIQYPKSRGLDNIEIGQDGSQISKIHNANPIDWFVYSSALPKENPNHPELVFCKENRIKTSKRDALINYVLEAKKLKLVAVSGTHGKTTTTAMAVWLFKNNKIPVSYSVGAELSFGEMGEYNEGSQYFIYEADEYDRNFLSYRPKLAIITGISWDHPDTYPSKTEYTNAFKQFVENSEQAVLWEDDAEKAGISPDDKKSMVLNKNDPSVAQIKLLGEVNRQNAYIVAASVSPLLEKSTTELATQLNDFPGLSRRFEELRPGLYSDYAHTPDKIRGALQIADEKSSRNFVVIYEGLHNTRQHFIKDELKGLFDRASELYVVPSYLAREDENLELLSPQDIADISQHKNSQAVELNQDLKNKIESLLNKKVLVLCLSAGGGGSLDEWLRGVSTG